MVVLHGFDKNKNSRFYVKNVRKLETRKRIHRVPREDINYYKQDMK